MGVQRERKAIAVLHRLKHGLHIATLCIVVSLTVSVVILAIYIPQGKYYTIFRQTFTHTGLHVHQYYLDTYQSAMKSIIRISCISVCVPICIS